MTDLAEQMRKGIEGNYAYTRGNGRGEYAPDCKEVMPEEYKNSAYDDWWGSTTPQQNQTTTF